MNFITAYLQNIKFENNHFEDLREPERGFKYEVNCLQNMFWKRAREIESNSEHCCKNQTFKATWQQIQSCKLLLLEAQTCMALSHFIKAMLRSYVLIKHFFALSLEQSKPLSLNLLLMRCLPFYIFTYYIF